METGIVALVKLKEVYALMAISEIAPRKEMTWRRELAEKLGKDFDVGEHFTIDDVYGYEFYFRKRHPNNRNIRATLRDLLNKFRIEGVIKFEDWGAGEYSLLVDPRKYLDDIYEQRNEGS